MERLVWQGKSSEVEKVIKELLANGTDVNAELWRGKTPLWLAVNDNNLKLAEFLLAEGAEVNIEDETAKTPLFLAISDAKNLPMAKFLLDKGADVNAAEIRGYTPLDYAIFGENWRAAKFLRENGGHSGRMHRAELFEAVIRGKADNAQTLLTGGANPNYRDPAGFAPLYYAIVRWNTAIARALVESGANLGMAGGFGEKDTALHHAASTGCSEIAELLLENGALPDARNADGQTPLHLAAKYENPDVVKVLLKSGADAGARDTYDMTPLDVARKFKRPTVVNVLGGHDKE